jgi:hypothetical protein
MEQTTRTREGGGGDAPLYRSEGGATVIGLGCGRSEHEKWTEPSWKNALSR